MIFQYGCINLGVGRSMLLSERGFIKIPNFVGKVEVGMLAAAFKTERQITELGRSRVEADLGPVFNKVEDFVRNQADYSVNFKKLWLVHSTYKNVDTSRLPYLPHFDRIRFLKVMIYLTDTSIKNGAFFARAGSVHEYELRRRMLPENHKEKFLNNAGDSGAFEAVEGNAGDAIVFDTNCPHFAGAVDVGQNRKVARFDYANPCWNSYWDRSPWQRVKRKLLFV